MTLRYPYEIRNEEDYFGNLPDEKVTKEMLDLAVHIVETKAGHFHPEKFEDHYERALKELIQKKQRGEKVEKPSEPPAAKVIDLLEALRQSAAREREVAAPAGAQPASCCTSWASCKTFICRSPPFNLERISLAYRQARGCHPEIDSLSEVHKAFLYRGPGDKALEERVTASPAAPPRWARETHGRARRDPAA